MTPRSRIAVGRLVHLLAFTCLAGLATGCVSPGLDGLSTLECRTAEECGGEQACVQGACVSRSPELCDGSDNDGDGRIDEGFDLVNSAEHCGACNQPCEGRCINGNCVDGDLGTEPDAGCVPAAETCDGADNDCDGETDNGVLNACGACGEVPEEICDETDNDCDGATDEDLPVCNGSCHIPAEAPCNGLDDDCDGNIDDAMEPPGGCGTCVAEEVTCDGEDEDCDGTPDDGLLNACAMCGEVPTETCNGIDDDCDGEMDETFPTPEMPCVAGVGACEHLGEYVCRADEGSGVETPPECVASPGEAGLELCGNASDDDCDGETDEGFADLLGQPCEVGTGLCFASGRLACLGDGQVACDAVEGAPRAEACDLLDNNCDGRIDELFDLRTDPENCGVCNRLCVASHAEALCVAGDCAVGDCELGYLDLDRNPNNGCECQPQADDPPDAEGLDTNCDGVDGTAAVSVFVSALRGEDCQDVGGGDPCPGIVPGTLDAPVRTLARALTIVAQRGHSHLILEQGEYTRNTAFTFDRDLEIHGGYLYDSVARTWRRPVQPEAETVLRAGRVRGEPAVIVSADVTLTLDTLTIDAPAAGAGQSAVGIRADACASLRLVRTVVTAGDGGAGGVGPAPGLAPENASVGQTGTPGNGGLGGANPDCPDGTLGGNGGAGGIRNGASLGGPGDPGGLGASRGEGALDALSPATSGADAEPGPPADPGVPGSAGGAIGAAGQWMPHGGIPARPGSNGGGGGGGGGGVSGTGAPDSPGPGGGGGGAGACGGLPGNNGNGGGASIGILVVGQCLVRLESSEVRASSGGSGGQGSGGTTGGRGRQGGPPDGSFSTGFDEAPAASGGRGGDGGCGGNGSGGSGGPSVGILRLHGAPLPELDPASFVSVAPGGRPGPGGRSAGCRIESPAGNLGRDGVAVEVGCCVLDEDCGDTVSCRDL